MYRMYIEKTLFPVTPGKLQMNINGTNKTLTLINEGEVNLAKAAGLTDISTEVLLPALTEYPFAVYPDGFQKPDYYLEKLEKWKQKKKPVTFKMLRMSPDGKKLLWDTSIPVTIEDYQITEDAAEQGFDVAVKISMKEYREWGAKKLLIKKSKKSTKAKSLKTAAVKKKTRKAKEPAKTYTVKKGDCLMMIARKQLNDASKWKSIYSLNKNTIEAAAKKHGRKSSSNGYWIYQGTKLKLPKS
ncbi:MAG: LysM peptidoglycan-binding domain-containing protein [Ruminococcus flavefaciens]|nr:LysM peptidoglycan-binding domain-containing protein [Ruminococcus flavefaciens]